MAISRFPIRPLAILVAFLLVISPVTPLVGAASDGDEPTPTGGALGEGSFTSVDQDDVIPIFTIFEGPEDDPFAQSVANMGDVDGDGVDDILVGSGWQYWREPFPEPKFGTAQNLLLGREDRAYNLSQLDEIGNGSSGWSQASERWVGDLNGDGHNDLVYNIALYILEDWDETGQIAYSSEDQYKLFVHYGTEDGFDDEPDMNITILPDDLDPNYTYFSWQFGGVGDANGDGYDDIFVVRYGTEVWTDGTKPPGSGGDPGNGGRADDPDEPPDKDPPEPWPEPNVTFIPPDFQLFYGSEDGLPSKPSWNGTPEMEERYWWLQGIHHADVNADGYSDTILASNTAPHIRVYHGQDEGMSLEPDMTVSFNTQFSYGWRLHAPVDFNGDEYDDVIIDYGLTEGLFDFVQYIYVFPGSELGIPTRPTEEYRLVLEDLSSDHSPRVVMADINGDGLDDVFVYARLMLRSGDSDEIRLQLHFNSGEGIPDDASWRHTYRTDWKVPQLNIADVGDFDADGYDDVVIPSPGEWVWWDDGTNEYSMGHLMIVNGGGIMDLMRPLTLREGPDLYAGYKAYNFRVNVNPTGLSVLPTKVQLNLDPNGADVTLEAGLMFGGSYFNTVTDPDGLVDLRSDLSDIVPDSDNNTIWVHFRVLFDWDWPHEDMCDAAVRTFVSNISTPFVSRDLFWVENDLDILGDLTASGSIQGDLEQGDWVRAGEEVTVSGPVVVYEGTTDVYPPSGVFDVVLMDNDGSHVKEANVAGQNISLTLTVDTASDPDENLTLTLQDLPGLATVVNQPRFQLGVDADLPIFTNAVPSADDWHSSSQVLVSITADDRPTSGVLSGSLEYSYSIDDGVTWTDWSTNGLETTSDGPMVDGLVLLTIPDGEDNFVRWRARDLVGNGPAISADLRIKVDTINVTYTDAFPDPNDWHTVVSVECGVTIRDMDGAGIQVSSIQYRVSHSNLSGYDDWQPWGVSLEDTQEISVSHLITMGDTPYNYVQWRAKDIAGNGYTTSPHYKVRVDTNPIVFDSFSPDVGPHGTSIIECAINVSDGVMGSGVLLASIDYRYHTGNEWSEWTSVGMEGVSAHNRFSVMVTFEDGENNRIQFRGSDLAGNGPSTSAEHYLTVDTTGPEFEVISPGPEEKQPGALVTVTVSVSDLISGINASAVQYRFGTEGSSSMGEWLTAQVSEVRPGTYTAQVPIEFAPGVDNLVQFRAADVLGNMAESLEGAIWVNRAPVADINSPSVDQVYRDNDLVTLNGTLSSDPDDDDLNYTWYIDLQVDPVGYGKVLETDLPVGIYNVTLVVTDDVGAEDTVSVQVTVEQYIPPSTESGGMTWWYLLALLLAILVVAGVIIYKRRQDQMEEWEEL
jgi:hypothetical protein